MAIALLVIGCKKETEISDDQKIEDNVRSYFFMDDSVDVTVTITDTIHVDELDFLMANVDSSLKNIQLDLDTLQLMIDDWNYKSLEPNRSVVDAKDAKIKALGYENKFSELQFKKAGFTQSRRIMLHLRRSIWADIAGFEANVVYKNGDENNELTILMDANYRIVD